MLTKQAGLFVLWVCAVTMVVGIYVVAMNWEQSDAHSMPASFALGGSSAGVTVTESIPPSYATISKAVPLIRDLRRCRQKNKDCRATESGRIPIRIPNGSSVLCVQAQ